MKLSLLVVCASLAQACIFVASDEDDSSPPARAEYAGALVLDWTIDGYTDADECDQGDATWLELSIYTSSGAHVADYSDVCDAFQTSVELEPGSYYAEAHLEDADGNPRTTSVVVDDFRIVGSDELTVPIDFPASSFY